MKKIVLQILFMIFFLNGCSSRKKFVSSQNDSAFNESTTVLNNDVFTKKLVQNIKELESAKNFKSLYIKANVRYEDDQQKQNVQADIRIKKDQMILVSIRLLGITWAKALITKDKVQYYEKPNGTHFEGDFATLSRWLGTELNFEKLQNLLVGNALFDLTKERLESKSSENQTGLFTNTPYLDKEFWTENISNQLIKQSFHSKTKNQRLQVQYSSFQNHNDIVLPSQISLEAIRDTDKTNIELQFFSVLLNEDFSFPYAVPSGSKLINID